MKILSLQFMKGLTGDDEIFHDGTDQIAFIGRSNVGKSSVINTLMQRRNFARSSPTPGMTRQINVYYVNKSFYLVDLPGYGFARGSWEERNNLRGLLEWYLLEGGIKQKKIVVIVDANVGVTDSDLEMLASLQQAGKNVIVLANKVDKIKKSGYEKQLEAVRKAVAPFPVIPYSAEEKIGVGELINNMMK